MSKFSEIIKLLPKGLKNIDKVIEGKINSIKLENNSLSEDEATTILGRRLICGSCPYMSKNAPTSEEYKALFGESYKTRRNTPHCAICFCGIDSKTASLSSNCGLESYNCDHPDNQQPLKWTAYAKDCI